MFDRLDADTTSIVDAALDESRRRDHSWLGTEHVLLALALHRETLPRDVAAALPESDAIAQALDAGRERPPRRDAELLSAVGIDLEAVRSSVRRTFGDGALEDLGRRSVHQPWQPWRRPTRRCMSILAGPMSTAPGLKRALENAHQEAERRALALIDPAALLAGMLQVEEAMSTRILRDAGVDLQRLRALLRSSGA